MIIILEDKPFATHLNCDGSGSCRRTLSEHTNKLEVKDGLIMCPICKKPLTGEIFLDL